MEILDYITFKNLKKTFENGDWLLRLMSMKKNLIKKKVIAQFPLQPTSPHLTFTLFNNLNESQ
jgi:hypothetical protein